LNNKKDEEIPTITEKDLANAEVMKRQVIIETDGTAVNVVKSDVSMLELNSICRIILKQIGGM